jgi:hypothetical protein
MIDESKQTLHLGEEESSLVHPVFTDDPSKVKWLKVDVASPHLGALLVS